MPKKTFFFLVTIIVYAIVFRVIKVMPNVSPVAAVAIWAGANLRRPLAWFVPLTVMLVADFFIGFYSWPIMLAVYGSFMISVSLGRWLSVNPLPHKIIVLSLASSSLFYLVTNLAVWQFSGLYSHTLPGLVQCYYYAVPFFRHTLLGDLAHTGALFAAWQYLPQIFFQSAGKKQTIYTANTNNYVDG